MIGFEYTHSFHLFYSSIYSNPLPLESQLSLESTVLACPRFKPVSIKLASSTKLASPTVQRNQLTVLPCGSGGPGGAVSTVLVEL